MSLPTPPSTSHREKENRFSASGSRVVWSQHNQYHCITNLPHVPARTRASKELPKSILKKRPPVLFPIQDNKQREITPEPSDPLVDLKYLQYPVSKIVAPDTSLPDLIEAYSVLAARIKAGVSSSTDVDASWPLFQPLRKNRDAIIDAFIRDLGRALVDPALEQPETIEEKVLLPSPKHSPRKKRGMSAEQAKYARDLCTTCHSVMKLLAAIFTLPAIYRVFTDKQLRAVLTQVLAIPLANELPTPNARKTCALSIWLIQVQRLPSEVLVPSGDRIAYALRRGMEGELGKEGKKGSASDGLKAIHDLCIYQPSTFVPAFTEILPSILANLLAPTLTRRSQACQALGGFALACTSLPPSYLHTRISSLVAAFITTDATPRKSPSKKSPLKKPSSASSEDAPIVRTIRTTLVANDPQHAAQGPVWSLSVLAHMIVLLGNALCTDAKVSRVISALLTLSTRHKKPAVQGLASLVWRVVVWAYFQPSLLANPEEPDVELDNDTSPEEEAAKVRESYWNTAIAMVVMGVGTGMINALLNTDLHDDDYLERVFPILKRMAGVGGEVCSHAMQIVKHFVSFEADVDWTLNKLLPPILFSANPGLLNTEFKSLGGVLRPVFGQFSDLDDVRSLTRDEVTKDFVFEALVGIWREGLACIELPDHAVIPTELMEIWSGLLTAIKLRADDADNEAPEYATSAATILIDVLQDDTVDLTPRPDPNILPTSSADGTSQIDTPPSTRTNAALKLKVIRDLWSATRTVIPHEHLGTAGEKLLDYLMKSEHKLTDGKDARDEWASLCAELLVVCDVDELKAFWGYHISPDIKKWEPNLTSDVHNLVWKCFVEKWKEDEKGNWEGGVVLLGVPFADINTWTLSNDDFNTWEDFLCHTINKALDYGIDSIAVLDAIAELVSRNQNPTFTSITRVADLLLSHLDMPDARQIPDAVMEFVNDTLRYSYPPEPRNKVTSMWVIRSLTRVIETCPLELAMYLLDTVQDGLCTWISDEYQALSQEEYTFDILALYEITLLVIQTLPRTVETLERVAPILESAFCGRPDKPASVSEAFTDFWQLTYATMPAPRDGWPDKIRNCLGLLTGVNVEDEILDNSCYDADTSFGDGDEADGSVMLSNGELHPVDLERDEFHEPVNHSNAITKRPRESPVFGHVAYNTLHRATIKKTMKAELDAVPQPELAIMSDPPSTPIRPSACSLQASTPPRPHKPSALLPFFPHHSPVSPIHASQRTPSGPKRTPLTEYGSGSCSSSNKRRRIENKENESPYPGIISVAERIEMKSPSRVPGKRRLLDGSEEDRPSKKCKPTSEPLTTTNSDSEDEYSVAFSLLDPVGQERPIKTRANGGDMPLQESTPPSLSPTKRKNIFMDAVELPTLREAYGLPKRCTSLESSSPFRTPTSRRTLPPRSTKLSRDSDAIPRNGKQGHGSGRKRRRSNDAFKSRLIGDPFSSSPLRVVDDVLPESDDFIASPSSELSSDDDPHLGQVTPHHLISPALHRARAMTDDPPSDDSDMVASPSRDIVSRRIQRSESLRALKLKASA